MASGAVIGSAYLEVIPKLSMNPLKKASIEAGKASGSGFDSGFGSGIKGIGGTVSKALGGVAKVAKVGAAATGAAVAYMGRRRSTATRPTSSFRAASRSCSATRHRQSKRMRRRHTRPQA